MLSFISLFFLVFDLKVVGPIGSSFITLIICGILLILKGKTKFNFIYEFRIFLFSYFLIFLFVLIRTLLSFDTDLSYLLTTLKTTEILIATFLYLLVFFDQKIIGRLFNVFLLNSLICVFFGYFSDLKPYFIYPFKFSSGATIELIGSNEYRDSFLSGSGYFGISSLYAFAFPLFVSYVNDNKGFFNYVKLFFIGSAGILAGRVALIAYSIAIFSYSLFYRKIKFILIVSFFCLIAIILLNSLTFLNDVNNWLLDIFGAGNYKDSSSLTELKEMFFLPNDNSLLIGDAKYANVDGTYYGNTDVGYIRNILFGGLVYLFFIFLALLTFFLKFRKNFTLIMMIIIALFLHGKGVFILNNPGFFPVLLIGASYYIYLQKYKGD
jgi:hypothetical protein